MPLIARSSRSRKSGAELALPPYAAAVTVEFPWPESPERVKAAWQASRRHPRRGDPQAPARVLLPRVAARAPQRAERAL